MTWPARQPSREWRPWLPQQALDSCAIEVVNGDVDRALKLLGRRVGRAGHLATLKNRETAPGLGARRRLKGKLAASRRRRAARRAAARAALRPEQGER